MKVIVTNSNILKEAIDLNIKTASELAYYIKYKSDKNIKKTEKSKRVIKYSITNRI